MQDFIFRSATRDDDARLLDLFRASFDRDIAPEVWNWLSYSSPTGLNRTTIVEDSTNGELVCSYSLLPIKIRFNGKSIRASLCTNVNTRPDYQGRGLFTRVGEHALAQENNFDTSISIGMPNPKALPGHKKVGWDVLFELPFLIKYDCRKREHRCREISQFDHRFDEFFAGIAEGYSFIVLKDYRFMNWRVVERPDKKYTLFIYEDGSKIRGYIVLKHFDDHGYLKSHILDIQADGVDVLSDLIAAAENFAAGRDELNLWTNSRNPYKQSFLASGFSVKESKDLLIAHFNFGDKEPLQENSWWFCLADNDVY